MGDLEIEKSVLLSKYKEVNEFNERNFMELFIFCLNYITNIAKNQSAKVIIFMCIFELE